MKLNLGCADRKLDGFVGVDIAPGPCVDQVADLREHWPWESDSVSEIRADDIIEHLPDKINTMNEAWRCLRAGGRFNVTVPTTDGRGAWQDPQHCSYWNRNSFFYFTHKDPHRERFGDSYGVKARFRVVGESQKKYPDEVWKLSIVLEAVK